MHDTFSNVMEYLFKKLNDEFYQLEAEIGVLRGITDSSYREILEKNKFEKYEQIVGVMYRTSREQSQIMQRIHAACMEALKQVGTDRRKSDVKKIINIVKGVEKMGFGYAERLPFSIGGGWKPEGSIGKARHIFNIPGYILLAPYIMINKKAGNTMFARSLEEMKQVMEDAREAQKDADNFWSDIPKGSKKNIERGIKDLKMFLRLTTKVQRAFKKAHRECKKIYNKKKAYIENLKIDQTTVYGADAENNWRKTA